MSTNLQNVFETETAINKIDQDFEAFEKDLDYEVTDLADLTRLMLLEIFEDIPGLKSQICLSDNLSYKTESGEGEIKHYYLPHIPGGENGNFHKIREGYDSRTELRNTPQRSFIRVGQGEMWQVPRNQNIHLKTSMSECSTIVSYNNNEICVAHVSYSELDSIEQIKIFLQENNFLPDQTYIIASVGEYQERNNKISYYKRATKVKDYTDQGFLPKNINTFEYSFSKDNETDTNLQKGLTQVIINDKFIHSYSFDCISKFHAHGNGRHVYEPGKFQNEKTIKL